MVIFPLTPDQTIAQMWSNGARGGGTLLRYYGALLLARSDTLQLQNFLPNKLVILLCGVAQ